MTDEENMRRELVEYVRARLDEDAEHATALDGKAWTAATDVGDRVNTSVVTDSPSAALTPGIDGAALTSGADPVVAWCGPDYDGGEERAEHIARHDPARVRLEVAAKRQLLQLCEHPDHLSGDGRRLAQQVLQALVLPYGLSPSSVITSDDNR